MPRSSWVKWAGKKEPDSAKNSKAPLSVSRLEEETTDLASESKVKNKAQTGKTNGGMTCITTHSKR